MAKVASALAVLGAALLFAQLGQFLHPETSWDAAQTGPATTFADVLRKDAARPQTSLLGGLGSGGQRLRQRAAAPARSGPESTAADAGPDPSHHDPLVTYHLSATSLTLQTATPQQAPGTHVVRLPLSGLAPLTSATYMPSDMKELSSKGYETYMVNTVEFLQNQAAANRLLEDWEAAGWVDPVTGAVTQPDTLPVCGATLARRRGYVAAALAAQAAAAHRPAIDITALAATLGVARLRTRCPQSLLLTRAGTAAAAVADVLDVTLLPGDGAAAGNGTLELLLRVVDNPRIVAEHDPGHPLQELEGRGNHYHFILPGDMSTDAPRLLEEVDSFRAGAWGLVLKGGNVSPADGSLQVTNLEFLILGQVCLRSGSCNTNDHPIAVSPTQGGSCSLKYIPQSTADCTTWCNWEALCTWTQPATVTLTLQSTGAVLATATVVDAAAVPTGCGAGNLLRSVGGTFSGNNYYCASGVACPVSVAPTDLSVSLDPASAGSCRVTASSSSCNADIAATCSTTCCPVSYTCNLEQIGAVTAKQFREGGVGNLAFICVVCTPGASSSNLPAGTYQAVCSGCCYNPTTRNLSCATCDCPSRPDSTKKTGRNPSGRVPTPCPNMVYNCGSKRLQCGPRGPGGADIAAGGP